MQESLEHYNRVIICKECGKEFDFTPGEQEFYSKNNLNDPVRCKECRDKRKAERAAREAQSSEVSE